MWPIPALALLLAPTQAPVPRMIEGISNGDFEYVWQPTPADTAVKGAFWVGAEPRIQGSAGARFLRFPAANAGDFVFQRVSCAHGKSASLSLGAKARITQAGDAACVTLIETLTPGDGSGVAGFTPPGSERLFNMSAAWSACTKVVDQWQFDEWTGIPPEPHPIGPCSTTTANHLDWFQATLTTGTLVATWTAPFTGTVRVVSRGIRLGDDPDNPGTLNPVDVRETILVGTAYPGSANPVRSVLFDRTHLQGTVFSTRISVTAGDKVFITTALENGTLPATFEWHPQIVYEGRRLTWYFTNSLLVPVNTSTQRYIRVNATPGSWAQITNVQAAALFKSQFNDPDDPQGPFEIELASPSSNVNRVDFDDVSLVREFEETTANDLRDQILEETRWVREQWRLILDRGAGMLGDVESAYQVNAHALYTQGEPGYATCDPVDPDPAAEPYFGWELLSRDYDDTEYDDFFTRSEQGLRQSHPSTGLLYPLDYDVCRDLYEHDQDAKTSATTIDRLVALWERTNDPTCLDVAFDYGEIVVANGIYQNGADPRNGIIFDKPYRVDNGRHPDASDASYFDNSFRYLQGAMSLLAGYVACTNYNASVATPRYPQAALDLWLDKIRVAAEVCAALKIYVDVPDGPDIWGEWLDEWSNLYGYFSDVYAYIAIFAGHGLDQLGKLPGLPPGSDEAALRDVLAVGILEDGADYYIGRWEQAVLRNETANGDSGRPWPAFARLMPLVSAEKRTRFAEQLLRAARHALRFQYAGGFWVTAGQSEHQQLKTDTTRVFSPPGVFQFGMSQVFRIANLPTATIQDWLASLKTIHQVTMDEFREEHGYRPLILPGQPGDLAGSERMLAGNYLTVLDNLPTSLPASPVATATPTSFSAPGLGTQFSFTIQFPAATSQAELATLLAENVSVGRWSVQGTTWAEQPLWPEDPSFFLQPIVDFPQRTVTLKTAAPIGSGAGEFKFDVHAWDAQGQWDRDTSYQTW